MADTPPSAQLAARPRLEHGAYVLRKLASDLPLSADGDADVRITCIEVWNGNLYVGTSAAEIIHFVLLPPEPDDPTGEPTAILASRQEPPRLQQTGAGVQQILLLPKASKALILCDNTLSFYSLPELSFDSTTKPLICSWVGGVDLNLEDEDYGDGVVVMLGLKSKLRLIRISEKARPQSLRTIEYGACLASVRREAFSCAADAHSYALLDLERQQKIGLFPISSLDPDAGHIGGAAESISTASHGRSASGASFQPPEHRGHGRSSSLGIFGGGDTTPARTESPRPQSHRYGFDVPESLSRTVSPAPGRPLSRTEQTRLPERTSSLPRASTPSPEKPLPRAPEEATEQQEQAHQQPAFVPLRPHVASPSPNEFLLTVGTTPMEPGVGMFVNLDGDMCRGSIQFSSYPDAIVVDGKGMDLSSSMSQEIDAEEGYVLAVVHQQNGDQTQYGVEIQRWDVDAGEGDASKEWLNLQVLGDAVAAAGEYAKAPLGMRRVVEPTDIIVQDIGEKLSVKKLQLQPSSSDSSSKQAGKQRSRQEKADLEFTERLSKLQSQTILWAGNQVWWTVRNPLVIRLDSRLQQAQYTPSGDSVRIQPVRRELEAVLGDIRGQDPRNEAEYLSLIYIRQKASILLFMDLILRSSTNIIVFENEKRITEQALIEGEIDPRVVMSLLPILDKEVVQGEEGIQISGGITSLVEQFLQQNDFSSLPAKVNGPFGDNILHLVKRYLLFWKKRKGMASVTNDPYVFQSVDAALLHILLLLDRESHKGTGSPGSLRSELYELVDNEVECFDRAVELLEQFKRLYVLSRLYQRNCPASIKASKVLATWRRILEGEKDEGGEFTDGETELRKYLSRIRDQSLVEDYGAWLANRNPKLGVQIFADDNSRVKFDPTRAVALLREKAPGAVKEYLEFLVFGKKHTQYVNELISHYLTNVTTELSTSPTSRAILLQTYETYRALDAPKPTYRAFITDNALPAEWWTSRLRLLQLLGSSGQSATSSYDVSAIRARLEPFEQELVPEMIILSGREGRHQEALRLLMRGLGDFDTAIRYCLLGGSSIFLASDESASVTASAHASSAPAPASATHTSQATLFAHLLHETLTLPDLSHRIERTSELLERFSGWFDVEAVLLLIPDDWSVDIVGAFLINALRRLVRERMETGIQKSLEGAVNLGMAVEVADGIREKGPVVEVERVGEMG